MRTNAATLGTCLLLSTACDVAVLPPPVTHTSLVRGLERQPPDDPMITAAVTRSMSDDDSLATSNVSISTQMGVVTLYGNTENLRAKERAVKIALSVEGVQSVVDRISLVPATRPDAEINADLERVLSSDSVARRYGLAAHVKDGVVRLEGAVDSIVAAELVTNAVKQVSGVRGVDDGLSVRPAKHRPDAEIQAEVTRLLHEDVWVDAGLLTVDVRSSVVTLTGVVGSEREKAWALRDARVPGVASVDESRLEVDTWVRREKERPSRVSALTDSEVKTALQNAFASDPRIPAHATTIDVADGVATLSGIVQNLRARLAAEEVARNTIGVVLISNLLEVRPDALPTDSELSRRLDDAFRASSSVGEQPVVIAVFHNKVLLTGAVQSIFQHDEATRIAAGVDGVIDVDNQLAVREAAR